MILVKRLAIMLLALLFSVVLAFSLFASKAYFAYNKAEELIQLYKSNGYSEDLKKEYLATLPILHSVITDATSSIFRPALNLFADSNEVDKLFHLYSYIEPALPVLPEILGLDAKKNYLIAFQNPAEARGTGGIIGAYAVVEFRGSPKIVKVGSNAELASLNEIPIKLPAEFSEIYRSDPAIWQNSNMSPHFPYGAKIWLSLWKKQFNQDLDGVITLDPFVLKSLLKITGPVTINGRLINQRNVIEETLSNSYLEFEDDNNLRKSYLVEIIRSTARNLEQYKSWSLENVSEISEPIFENRVLFYSQSKKIRKAIKSSPISGFMRKTPSNEFRLVIQNTAGNKMDYYLQRNLKLSTKTCRPEKISQVEVTIENSADRNTYLPDYVKGRLDLDLPSGKENSTAISLFIYGPPSSKLISAMDVANGSSAGYVKMERNRPVLIIPLQLDANERQTFIADFQGGTGKLKSYVQPLVEKQINVVEDNC